MSNSTDAETRTPNVQGIQTRQNPVLKVFIGHCESDTQSSRYPPVVV